MSSLNKLRNLSFDELRVRGSQKVAAWAERHGWSSLTSQPRNEALLARRDREGIKRDSASAVEFLADFRSPSRPKFFPGLADREATIQELRKRWPAADADIVARANRISEGQFDLLGFSSLSFGDPINWHLEPVSGKATPLVHWSK
ncbi:MAG: hypothetical protein ACRD2L_24540, partial [Terriglobia bacterium]